jgi:hypothetical protein
VNPRLLELPLLDSSLSDDLLDEALLPNQLTSFGVVRIDGARMKSGEVFGLLGRIERKREIEAELGFRVAAATSYRPQGRRRKSRRTGDR